MQQPFDYAAEIQRESERFYVIADTADPTRPVAACPEWTVADLVWHLGACHWFWASDVEMRATSAEMIEANSPTRPDDYRDVVAFGRAQAERLVSLLHGTDDNEAVWTWALNDEDHTVGFVRRHQVQEAAVHRWDIEDAATGAPADLDPVAAADAIDEVLAITVPWGVHADKPLPGTVHIHCTDTPGEWLVHVDGRVDREHAKGDAAVRGRASDLLLAMYSRRSLESVEVIGDGSVAEELFARINTA